MKAGKQNTGFRCSFLGMEKMTKKGLTLGDWITAAYQVWGAGQAEKMVCWALDTRRVVRRKQTPLLISTVKKRFA
jgi:hypothetical protein